jgi:hypothetical protein
VSSRAKTTLNVAVIAAIAAAVYFVPGGGRAANTAEALLYIGFGVGIGYFGLRLYREYRVTLHGLGDRRRALLYGALALGMVAIVARARLWYSGLQVNASGQVVQVHRWGGGGEVLWFAIVGLVVYALVAVYRFWRTY